MQLRVGCSQGTLSGWKLFGGWLISVLGVGWMRRRVRLRSTAALNTLRAGENSEILDYWAGTGPFLTIHVADAVCAYTLSVMNRSRHKGRPTSTASSVKSTFTSSVSSLFTLRQIPSQLSHSIKYAKACNSAVPGLISFAQSLACSSCSYVNLIHNV